MQTEGVFEYWQRVHQSPHQTTRRGQEVGRQIILCNHLEYMEGA
jgi:hypothetical protein